MAHRSVLTAPSGRARASTIGIQAVLGLGALIGVAAFGAEAAAQSQSPVDVGDPFTTFLPTEEEQPSAAPGYETAPGYNRPDRATSPSSRDAITVFEEPPQSTEPASLDRPINEFAGQRQRYDRGIVGDILGTAKDTALGR